MNRIVIAFFLLVLLIATLIFATAVVTVGALIAAAWVIGKWLEGWHVYEKAIYTSNMQAVHDQREAAAAEQLRVAAGQVPGRKPGNGLKLPR